MNKRDKKIATCDFDYWIIFIYVCINNNPVIALFHINNTWMPFVTDIALSFEDLEVKIRDELSITRNQCFKDRFLSAGMDVNYKENPELNAWASYIRLKNNKYLNPTNKKFQAFKWFHKSEALSKLQNKTQQVAFHRIFREDTFWECLDTEKIGESIQETFELSKQSKKRYKTMTKDFESKRNIYIANDAQQLIKDLNEDPLP